MQIKAGHLTTDELNEALSFWRNGEPLSHSAAVTVAAGYQSPGRVGNKLAAFASGCEVDSDELLADIEATLQELPIEDREDPHSWLAALREFAETPVCVTCGSAPWGFGYCGEECEECAAS